MGAFRNARYEGDDGGIYSVRVEKETLGLATNPQAEAVVNRNGRPKISKTNREFGIRPRIANLGRTVEATIPGVAADGSDATKVDVEYTSRIPILTKAVWNGDAFKVGAAVAYRGENWNVTSRLNEDY